MDIKIDQWIPDTFKQNEKVVGHVRVLLNEKLYIWMTVLRGKSKCFCKFPSTKIQEGFVAAIGWTENEKMERTISDHVISKLEAANEL
jgi:hypothetical protein